MSKRLEAMRANPAADWRIRDVEMVCAEFGLRCSPPRGGGSHYKIGHAFVAGHAQRPVRAADQVGVYSQVRMVDAVARA